MVILVVSFRLQELLVEFVCSVPCKIFFSPHSTLSTFWSCGGALRDLPFLLLVWITFREENLSLKVALQTLMWESDASFLLGAWMPFMDILDCLTCSRFSFVFKWVFMEVSSCQSSPEDVLGLWFGNIHNCNRYLFFFGLFSFTFSFGLVDRFFFFECMNGQSFPIWHLSFLKYLQCEKMPSNSHTLDRDNNLLFCSWSIEDDLLFQVGSCLSFWHIVVLPNCLFQSGFLIDFLRLSISLPCHVGMNIFRLSSTSLLTPKIDNLCFFSSAPFEEYAAAALSLDRSLWEINMFCSCCSRMSLTIVLTLWLLLGSFSRTMSCWFHVFTCFMSVDLFYLVVHTSSPGRAHPNHDHGMVRLSSQAWLKVLGLSLYKSRLRKSLKVIVCPRVSWMLTNRNTWNVICLPVSIGRLFLYWACSKKLISLLKSAGIIVILLTIFESRASNSSWCLSNLNPAYFNSSFTRCQFNDSLTNRRWVDPVVPSLRKETFQELTFDACGQGSNSNFSALFPFEVPSSVTDRVSDKAVEVDGTCSHGLLSADRHDWNGESAFSVGVKDYEQSILMVVDEEMNNARGFSSYPLRAL